MSTPALGRRTRPLGQLRRSELPVWKIRRNPRRDAGSLMCPGCWQQAVCPSALPGACVSTWL